MKFAQARLSPPGLAQIMGEAAVDLPDHYFDAPKAEYLRTKKFIGKKVECNAGSILSEPRWRFLCDGKIAD